MLGFLLLLFGLVCLFFGGEGGWLVVFLCSWFSCRETGNSNVTIRKQINHEGYFYRLVSSAWTSSKLKAERPLLFPCHIKSTNFKQEYKI